MTGPINLDSLRAKHRRAKGMMRAAVLAASDEAGNDAVSYQRSHVEFKPRSGALQAATEARAVRLRSGAKVILRNAKKYAASIDRGARPHVIVPRRGNPLTFQVRGRWVSTWKVHHPGNRAYRFLYNATRHGFRMLAKRLAVRLDGVARKF